MNPHFKLNGKMEDTDKELLFWLVITNVIIWSLIALLP